MIECVDVQVEVRVVVVCTPVALGIHCGTPVGAQPAARAIQRVSAHTRTSGLQCGVVYTRPALLFCSECVAGAVAYANTAYRYSKYKGV